jgi:predicted ATPase/signal transduction histidine kinase
MMTVPGYRVTNPLYESAVSRLYRGTRLSDGLPVVLKALHEDARTPERRARFNQEYQLTRKLSLHGVIAAYALHDHLGSQVMVLEDFGGESLNRLGVAGKLPLTQWLELAIGIVDCLAQLHARHVMHKDINPSNIVWNRESGVLKLIDLGISTELSRETPEMRSPEGLEGTLPYLSPEQTGRMNRTIDYRTDFYSLGVTFYQLLAGRLPFEAGDAMQMVHAHIAMKPVSVCEIKPEIPQAVSTIVDKLLAKTAEERYQSAAGLKADLQICLNALKENGRIVPFALATQDLSERLQISQKLYGREAQLAALLDAFDRTSQGQSELLMVAGYSGVGKSALVREVHRPIVQRRGYFIQGKFDQFRRDIPYSALMQAFSGMIRQLLTEGDEVVATWKIKILDALGGNGQVMVDVIPDLELLIGAQSPVLELPSTQAQNRFNHAFGKFVATFASADHPLVIFLDDLQWADLPSLKLVSLLAAPGVENLLLIGAYRDNEVDPMHPLPAICREMQNEGKALQTLTLAPLDTRDVEALLADSLRTDRASVASLVRLGMEKTAGNPFFLNQFLGALVADGMLFLDRQERRWRWDVAGIEQAGITDNVVDLMLGRLHRLPPHTQSVLKAAGCLGNTFDLQLLAHVCRLPESETAERLWPALAKELIVPLDARYKHAASDGGSSAAGTTYRFLHDRVQQAAYLLSDADERASMHLAVARLWLKTYSAAERNTAIFELVNHLNDGRVLITDTLERRELAQLNLAAAQRARASAAYRPAFEYLQIALEAVAAESWQPLYELKFALHLAAAESAYLCLEFDRMEDLVKTALQHARDELDTARMYEIWIRARIAQARFKDAVGMGLEVLKLLGVDFPKSPGRLHTMVSLMQTRLALAGKSVEELAKLPDATDPRFLAISEILMRISLAAYFAAPGYFMPCLLKAIRLTLRHGYAAPSGADFAGYGGMILCGAVGNVKLGAQYGQLALQIQERPVMAANQCRTMVVVHTRTHPWIMSLHDILKPLSDDYLAGIKLGDMEFAALAARNYCLHAFYCGIELNTLEREVSGYLLAVGQMQRPSVSASLQILGQALHNLANPSDQPCKLEGAILPAERMRALETMTADRALMFYLHSTKMLVACCFGSWEAALDSARLAESYANAVAGSFGVALVAFYGSLARLALLPRYPYLARAGMLRKIRRNQKRLKYWSRFAPANFLHKWHLVEAELARYGGRTLAAVKAYEHAVKCAAESGFLGEEALALELAGQFHLEQGHETVAGSFLRKAHHCYQRWGADAKRQQLEQRYPRWLRSQPNSDGIAVRTTTTIDNTTASNRTLDLDSVMKASRVLSQEIVLERLLKRLMDIALENAGAQRGVLLLARQEGWRIQAEKNGPQVQATVLQSTALDEAADLPLSLIHYVMRTRESIVIREATEEPLSANDAYVQRKRLRSVMVVPIMHQGEMNALLYLENNVVAGAFTERRLELLQLLASQTAISIENALLYGEMEERVQERTAEVRDAMKVLEETQQQLILREKMASVGSLTAGVAHEINNPANFAHAGTQTLKAELERFRQFLLELAGEDADAQVLERINERINGLVEQSSLILEGTSRIRDLVLDMRSFARLDEAEKKGVAIGDSLMSTVNLVRTQYAHNVDIRCHLEANPVLECWPAQLNQVFMNLIVNGCQAIGNKHKQEGGSEPGVLEIRSRIEGDWLVLEFEDSGTGIAPELVGRIFEPFFTTKDVGEGTGLGLSISFRIIEKHHGSITVRSTVGQGACFTVRLPVRKPVAQASGGQGIRSVNPAG